MFNPEHYNETYREWMEANHMEVPGDAGYCVSQFERKAPVLLVSKLYTYKYPIKLGEFSVN